MVQRQTAGLELTGENVRSKLKKCGDSTQLNVFCKICKPEVVEIGEHTRICDFAFIWGGLGVKIGDYVDFQPKVAIWGGGEIVIGNYVSIGVGSTLLTAYYSYTEGLRMVDGRPDHETNAVYGKLVIEDDVYIGANSTIFTNVIIGRGAIIGANSLINKTVEPWGIYVGSPAKKIGIRPEIKI